MRTSAELREGFLAFFEEKGHLRRPSASLIPRSDDRSTLLTTAGMQPQMPFFLGREQPPAPLTTTSQKCFRTPDIDEVGLDTYHLTFFEMLGNFSFGQYFKEGAIELATEFVRDRMGLDWERVWASVFAGDPELGLGPDDTAIELWERIGMPPERIVRLPATENFWSVGGPGPCGPDSEIYYDRGAGWSFAAADGVTPPNAGRGYVMGGVVRRAVQQASRIWLEPQFLAGLADVVIEQMGDAYPELPEHRGDIHRILSAEEERFSQTLARGLRLCEEVATGPEISGEDAFLLHNTYGFPIELTQQLARERGLGVNNEEFTRLMEEHREISRRTSALQSDVRFPNSPRTQFAGYERTAVLTAISASAELGDGLFQAKLEP